MNKNINAFPIEINEHTDNGMTLRDYFAAAALQGLIANKRHMGIDCLTMSNWAYKVADAMLNERENYDY
jgi:hypothetical protein